MAQSTAGFPSRRADKLTLSRSQIEEVFREAIPSLRSGKGAEATGLCPFHDDKNPSFSVDLDEGLWHCHAGCGGGNIYQFIARKEHIEIKDVDHYLQRRFGVTETQQHATKARQIIRQYHWVDENGHEAWKHRWSSGGRFSWSQDKENRQPGQGECQPTLYLLPVLKTVSKVIIVEGERDAETVNQWLRALGITDILATCTPNGAADVKPAYAAPLCGKQVVWVSGDNDPAGQGYLEKWGTQLHGKVGNVHRLPVPEGVKDWTEWQQNGGTAEAFRMCLDQAAPFILTEVYSDRSVPPAMKEVKEGSSPPDVAEAFLEQSEYRNKDGLSLRWHHSQWYGYDGKAFSPIRTEDLKTEVLAFIQRTPARSKARSSFLGDVLMNLSALCRMTPPAVLLPARWISSTKCVHQPKSIVVQNGIVDLTELFAEEIEDALSSHTPEFVSTVSLPFDFDPNALCPRWETFLEQILPDQECRQLLQEIFGYCLTYDTSQQKFFMFEGSGANGKGVVLRILTLLLGEKNISSLPLESFSEKHDLVATLGKLVNITSEVGDLDKVGEGLLKQFTGEDMMHFNPKYQSPFSARPTARLILATNVRPPFKDRSDGLWRRLIVLPFPVTIPQEYRNPHLTEELAGELSGIFNWAVIGAWSLHERGQFIEPENSRLARDAFQRESNPARLFLEEDYEVRPEGEVGKQALYERYRRYCQEHGQKALNATNFAKEVQRVFPGVMLTKPRRQGSRCYKYEGIANKREPDRQDGLAGSAEAA